MKYLLGIDLGTSSTKTVLFTSEGQRVASSTVDYAFTCPQNGWAEQNPQDWWNAVKITVKKVITDANINNSDIAGVGISGQMHGLVMLDKNGEVLRDCILWCDGRTSEECHEITKKIGESRLIEISANPALTGFTAGKILWVRKHEPAIYNKCAMILLPKDYIRYKLTGVFATEVSDASGTNLFDVPNRCWSDEILTKLEIDKELLPKVFESIDITGEVSEKSAQQTGLAVGTPVVGGAADNMAAAIGTGVVETGKAFTTIGTSGVVYAHSDEVSIDRNGSVHTFCSAVPGAYAVMSCTLSAGLSLKWFRDTLCNEEIENAKSMEVDPYYLMDLEAEKSPIGANRLIFMPYLMGERSPILDERARGVFFGLNAMHTKADMIRAILEGVIYSQKSCINVFKRMGIFPNKMYACGGGATSKLWRKMMADIYGNPVVTTDNKEGAALGVAILVAVGVGLYSSIPKACKALIKENSTQNPVPENTRIYDDYSALFNRIYPSLKYEFYRLSEL